MILLVLKFWQLSESVLKHNQNEGQTMDTMALKNERTGKIDFIRGVTESHRDYIPQDESCLALFDLYVLSGKSERDACIEVLRLVTKTGTAQ